LEKKDCRKEIEAMVVICPKCKTKLKVADERIAPQGTRFKCPKCSTVLLVKRPVAQVQARPLDRQTVLVAHEDPAVMKSIESILTEGGFRVIPAGDGIQAMVNATKELPFLAILSVSLPKIYGFEVGLRLKKRPETSEIKIILVASPYDKDRYRREPASLHGADAYIEDHQLDELLIAKIASIRGGAGEKTGAAPAGKEESAEKRPAAPQTPGTAISERGTGAETEKKEERPPQALPPAQKPAAAGDLVEKARRLARTIVADIYLYNKAKVDEAVIQGTFHATFASDLKEGLKLYENRISPEVKKQGDFFNEAITDFIAKRKKEI
jgi:predicted Zn finger-like uncharacterized protein